MPDIVYAQDDRLIDVTAAVAAVSNTRLVVANPTLQKLVNVAFAGSAFSSSTATLSVLSTSAALSGQPKAIAANATYVFALGAKKLWRCSNSAALDTANFAVSEYVVESENPLWIVERNGYLYMPWSTGGVIVYTQHGVLVARYDGILHETSLGAVDTVNGLLYLADGRHARGMALTINSDGTLTSNQEFAFSGCKDIVALIPDASYLAVACRDRISLFTVAAPTSPVLAGSLPSDVAINDMVSVATNSWWVASDELVDAQSDRFDYGNQFAIFVSGKGVYAFSALSGRIVGEAGFTPIFPTDVVEGINQAPVVNAGADQSGSLTGTLTGTATDPEGDTLTYLWTTLSGPGSVTFGTATALTTTYTLPLAGTYVVQLSVSDGTNTRTDTVSLTYTAVVVAASAYDFFDDFGTNNPGVLMSVIVGNILYCLGTGVLTADATVNGVNGTFLRRNCWAWDLTTGYVTSWDPFRTNTGVSASAGQWIANASDGSGIFIGGLFTTINGVQRRGLLKVDYTTGASIDAFSRAAGSNATATGWTVRQVFTYNGKVYFSDTGNAGVPLNTLKVVNETTGALSYEHQNTTVSADSPNNLGASLGGTYGFAVDATGYYVAFNGLTTVYRTTGGNVTGVNRIAKFDFSGNIITAFAPNTAAMMPAGSVIRAAAIGGSRVYVGGYDPVLAQALIAMDKTTGAADATFNARGSATHEAYISIGFAIQFLEYVAAKSALLWSGGIYQQDGVLRCTAGAMDAVSGAALNLRPARFGKTYDSALVGVGGTDGTCSRYYAAGDVVINHQVSKPGTKAMAGDWNAPTRLISYDLFPVGAGSLTNDAVLVGSVLYLVGTFTNIFDLSGAPGALGTAIARNQVGAFDLTTGLATAFWNGKAALSGGSANINACDTDAGGTKLFVAGSFTSIGGTAGLFSVARLDLAGSSVDAVFTVRLGTGAATESYHLCKRLGGLLFLARSNLDAPETTYKIHVLDATTLATLATHTTTTGPVLDVEYNATTGDYWLCGAFTAVNGTAKVGLAKFNSSHALQSFVVTFTGGATEAPCCLLVYNGYLYCGGPMGISGVVNNQTIKSLFAVDLSTDLFSPPRSPAALTTSVPSNNGIWHMAVNNGNLICCVSSMSAQWNNKFTPQTTDRVMAVNPATLAPVDRFYGSFNLSPRKSIPVPALGLTAFIFGTGLAGLTGAAPPAGNPRAYLRLVRDVP